MKMKQIKLFQPIAGYEEEIAIKKILKSDFWASGSGSRNVLKFETQFNRYVGSKKCVAVNNGTSALHLALSLIDIKNKEVIVPSLSFISTANAVRYNGGIPVFCDVDPLTLCLNGESIKKLINKKTKVILPVHFAGMPANLDEISDLCEQHTIVLMEDAAHAAGASYKGKKIGSHGTAVCFSFHPVKNLAMPTGGAITLNSKNAEKFSKLLKIRRWCGISNRKGAFYDINELGWNFYMNEFSAAIGLVQLKKLDRLNNKRKKIAKRYWNEINVMEKMPYNEECSYHFYWIQVKNRYNFMKKMLQNNIETGVHYKPIHKMKLYNSKIKLPYTEWAGEHIVSLPTHPNLSDSDITKIIECVNKFN
jgi:dTDP-4-amino-4,6-dideoxygalactose transaminase